MGTRFRMIENRVVSHKVVHAKKNYTVVGNFDYPILYELKYMYCFSIKICLCHMTCIVILCNRSDYIVTWYTMQILLFNIGTFYF